VSSALSVVKISTTESAEGAEIPSDRFRSKGPLVKWMPDKLTESEERITIVFCWFLVFCGLCFFAGYSFEIVVSPAMQGNPVYWSNFRLLLPFALVYTPAALYVGLSGRYKRRILDLKAIKWDLVICGILGGLFTWWAEMVFSGGMMLDPDNPVSAPYPWRAMVHTAILWCYASLFLAMLAFLVFRRGMRTSLTQ
jgi:hypothetical protein